MPDEMPPDHAHLLSHARALFPLAQIIVTYEPDEIIYIDVDDHRFTFEIGSDDDAYFFSDGCDTFTIPLFLDLTWE